MKIGIGTPSPDRIHPDFALDSLQKIISYTRKNLPDIELFTRYQMGVRTDRNRNIILKEFIEAEMNGVLWLDCDMVYPPDIIERYMDLQKLHGEMSVIGCLYFKRSDDHKPIGYVDANDDPSKPFRPLMPQLVKRGKIYEVTGLGYGGMYVPMNVYNKMGDDKWTRYGENFYNPDAKTGNLTHDLVFCKAVKKHGFKLFLHGSVRPGHIGEKLVTEEDFYNNFPPRLLPGLKVVVCMPTTDVELAEKTARVMQYRAGYDAEIIVVEDKDRKGFIYTANVVYESKKADCDYFVYTAQDAFVGGNWLAEALIQQFKTQKGLTAFNDGKWNGQLASFGMVTTEWANGNYDGKLFYDKYKSHYADTELTQIAKDQNEYTYAKDSIMLEIDYQKGGGDQIELNQKDRQLYRNRVKKYVKDKKLQEQFL